MGSWKKVTRRPDLRLWAARAVAMRATVLEFAERYPWAVGVVAVPLTVLGLAGVAIYPYVFVPLLVLASLALIVVEVCATQQEEADHRSHVAAGAHGRNRQSHLHPLSDLSPLESEARAEAEAAEARRRATELRAQAEAAEARAVAAEARARQLRHDAEAETIRFRPLG